MMNIDTTTESRPACVGLGSALPAFSRRLNSDATHEDKGVVQDIVVVPNIIAVKLFRFLEGEVGARVVGLQQNE